MRLTGDTKIRLSQIIDLKTWRYALTEDAKHYNIGDISTKTGLQKCLINGSIVWLLPGQQSNYLQSRMSNSDAKTLAHSAKLARADGYITLKGNIKNAAIRYLNYMKKTWGENPVKARYLNNTEVRLNAKSYKHLFESKGKSRTDAEIKERAECLPYVRDILERTGKPADHTINSKGEEAYTIVGKAKINNKDRNIKVVISKGANEHHYYLSVFKIN